MPNLGPTELIVVLVVVLIVFGVGKLPEVGGALGKGIREFKKAQTEVNAVKQSISDPLKPDSSTPSAKVESPTSELKS